MTTGEGGMLTTDDEDLAQKLRLMRSHGMTKPTIDRHHGHAFDYDVVALGYNYRMDEMRAALGLVQLRKLEKNNQKRADLVSFYQECLQDIDEVAVPYQQAGAGSAYHLMPILLPLGVNRQSFMQSLKDAGIQTSIHYPLVPELSFYQNNYPWDVDKLLPTAKNIAQREVTLPLYPTMTPCDVDYICTQIKNYFSQKREGI